MKTIAVLGGSGPQATMDFEARVHAVAQRLIPQRGNTGYPPMLVYYHRALPMLVDEDNKPLVPRQVDPRLLEAVKRLGASADFLVLTSNATHQFQQELEQASGLNVLSMIDLVINEIRQRGWKYVGVLGFGEPTVYLTPLRQLDIACETISAELMRQLDQAILAVMEGRAGEKEASTARIAVERMRLQRVDGTILGCTEIPLLIGQADRPDFPMFDTVALHVEAAVNFALG